MNFRTLVRTGIEPLIKNDFTWSILKPFAIAGTLLNNLRIQHQTDRAAPYHNDFAFIFKEKKVLHGPFKGLKYDSYSSVCSAIYPKLIGSYERELHETIEQFCKNDYSEVIDIGCAEGYYAVGFALRKLNANIYAYDTSKNARALCSKMAEINGVSKNIQIRSFCSAKELEDFSFKSRGLIISDCEAYEWQLFNNTNVGNLKDCDLLIEIHETVDYDISYLINLFSQTHQTKIINSIDDLEKARTYVYPETDQLDLKSKKQVYQEGRPIIMQWLVCTVKLHKPDNILL